MKGVAKIRNVNYFCLAAEWADDGVAKALYETTTGRFLMHSINCRLLLSINSIVWPVELSACKDNDNSFMKKRKNLFCMLQKVCN